MPRTPTRPLRVEVESSKGKSEREKSRAWAELETGNRGVPLRKNVDILRESGARAKKEPTGFCLSLLNSPLERWEAVLTYFRHKSSLRTINNRWFDKKRDRDSALK
ncbi:hypothetical protein NPIL_477331 [Nephila pilipes]|uniref:Uncharacterized protein n=1 Tax=Nephila pilipes TaxID=299642 RepID=A0A8X6U660_NEPPI|nr:hypothetical protein NPIL_477331 [Nephila pilipes]